MLVTADARNGAHPAREAGRFRDLRAQEIRASGSRTEAEGFRRCQK
jgi:hypothetical protein